MRLRPMQDSKDLRRAEAAGAASGGEGETYGVAGDLEELVNAVLACEVGLDVDGEISGAGLRESEAAVEAMAIGCWRGGAELYGPIGK